MDDLIGRLGVEIDTDRAAERAVGIAMRFSVKVRSADAAYAFTGRLLTATHTLLHSARRLGAQRAAAVHGRATPASANLGDAREQARTSAADEIGGAVRRLPQHV